MGQLRMFRNVIVIMFSMYCLMEKTGPSYLMHTNCIPDTNFKATKWHFKNSIKISMCQCLLYLLFPEPIYPPSAEVKSGEAVSSLTIN
jgi:hypothetical protein